MTGLMFRPLKNAEEDKSRTNTRIQNPQKDEGRNHKREGNLLVDIISQRTKCWRGIILIPSKRIHNSTHTPENYNLRDRHGPECFRKILGVAHLGDERWERDLSNEGVAYIQKGTHARDEGGSGEGDGGHDWFSTPMGSGFWIYVVWVCVIIRWVIFDSSEDGGEQDGDECEEC